MRKLFFVCSLLGCFVLSNPGMAQEPATVQIWVPGELRLDPADKVFVLSQARLGSASLDSGCGVEAGEYPIQAARAVDPASGEGPFLGVIVLQELPADTRLVNIVPAGSCTAGGVGYQRFTGVVQ